MTIAPRFQSRSRPPFAAFLARRCSKRSFLGMCAWQRRPAMECRSCSTTYIVKAQKAIFNSPRRLSRMPRNALGKGLSALIREPELNQQQQPAQGQVAAQPSPVLIPAQPMATGPATTAAAPALAPADGLLHLDIDLIDPSPYQPRSRFREEALEELARSIRASGIVQPLVVRKVGARHQLIAGERRWRAAQRAGLSRVPIVIRNVP